MNTAINNEIFLDTSKLSVNHEFMVDISVVGGVGFCELYITYIKDNRGYSV